MTWKDRNKKKTCSFENVNILGVNMGQNIMAKVKINTGL